MRQIAYGLLWFQLLLMNVGLGAATIALVLLIVNYPPLVDAGPLAMIGGLVYIFFYVLLVIGVIGLDAKVMSKGIKHFSELVKDA